MHVDFWDQLHIYCGKLSYCGESSMNWVWKVLIEPFGSIECGLRWPLGRCCEEGAQSWVSVCVLWLFMCLIGVICADLALDGRKRVMFTHGLNANVMFGLKYIIYGLIVGCIVWNYECDYVRIDASFDKWACAWVCGKLEWDTRGWDGKKSCCVEYKQNILIG